MSRRTVSALLLAAPLLAGCITRALWNWSDPDAVPPLETSTATCRIDAVLAAPGADPRAAAGYAVGFTPVPGSPAPRHVAAQAAAGPAWLWVRPRIDVPAAASMDAFEPRGHELDVFDGQHLRRRTNNVRMTLYGTVAPEAVGELLPADRIAERLRESRLDERAIPPWGPTRRALDGLGVQPWTRLLARDGPPPPEGNAEPVAFLSDGGAVLDPAVVDVALMAPSGDPRARVIEGAALLARVRERDRTAYVRVPLPVLLNADALTLRRDGGEIAFAWARRGVGRFVPASALPRGLAALELPLVDRRLRYEWSTELPTESGWKTPIQVLLTPIAAVLDFVIETNPALRALRDALFPPPPPPVRPRGGR